MAKSWEPVASFSAVTLNKFGSSARQNRWCSTKCWWPWSHWMWQLEVLHKLIENVKLNEPWVGNYSTELLDGPVLMHELGNAQLSISGFISKIVCFPKCYMSEFMWKWRLQGCNNTQFYTSFLMGNFHAVSELYSVKISREKAFSFQHRFASWQKLQCSQLNYILRWLSAKVDLVFCVSNWWMWNDEAFGNLEMGRWGKLKKKSRLINQSLKWIFGCSSPCNSCLFE